MKALFLNRFPFVLYEDEELNKEELQIKKEYGKAFPIIEKDEINIEKVIKPNKKKKKVY